MRIRGPLEETSPQGKWLIFLTFYDPQANGRPNDTSWLFNRGKYEAKHLIRPLWAKLTWTIRFSQNLPLNPYCLITSQGTSLLPLLISFLLVRSVSVHLAISLRRSLVRVGGWTQGVIYWLTGTPPAHSTIKIDSTIGIRLVASRNPYCPNSWQCTLKARKLRFPENIVVISPNASWIPMS